MLKSSILLILMALLYSGMIVSFGESAVARSLDFRHLPSLPTNLCLKMEMNMGNNGRQAESLAVC